MNCINFYNAERLVEKFSECTRLTHLDLSHNQIKPEGVENISKVLEKLTLLKHLDLSYNSISEEAIRITRVLTKCTSMIYIDLRNNFIRPVVKRISIETMKRILEYRECEYLISSEYKI